MNVRVTKRPLKTLFFDTECRPMHYSEWRPESQITAYAFAWGHQLDENAVGLVRILTLEPDLVNEQYMLDLFLQYVHEADMIVGHYIRKHDLPLVNDHCIRLGVKPLSETIGGTLVQDTKIDIPQVKALGLSQDNLSTMLRLERGKQHMTGAEWRRANALVGPESKQLTEERVIGDVRQNVQLYRALQEREALRPPRRWP